MLNTWLTERFGVKGRFTIYIVIFVLALAAGSWKAAEGDPVEAVISFIFALSSALSISNVPAKEPKTEALPSYPTSDERYVGRGFNAGS